VSGTHVEERVTQLVLTNDINTSLLSDIFASRWPFMMSSRARVSGWNRGRGKSSRESARHSGNAATVTLIIMQHVDQEATHETASQSVGHRDATRQASRRPRLAPPPRSTAAPAARQRSVNEHVRRRDV
jgi:hypothetical protein